MNKLMFVVIGMAVMLLLLTGCEREITGNVAAVDNANEDCLQCHAGLLDQAQGEWANSTHASGANVDYTNRGGSDCGRCHNQDGYLYYLENGTLPDEPFESAKAIGCFTCHDPHGTGTLAVRQTDPYVLENGYVFDHGDANQCAACHHARFDVTSDIYDNIEVSRRFGPHHSNQSDMISGTNGWEFPGEDYQFPLSPHVNQVEEACVGCHMADPRTHAGYVLGGHSWNMHVDGVEDNLAGVCAASSCHGEDVEEYDFLADADYDNDGTVEGYQTEIHGMLDSLEVLLEIQGVLDEGSQFSTTIADANLAGALYNWVFIEEDQSSGIHNFNYARSLLEASIDYVSQMPVPAKAVAVNDKPALDLIFSH
ncbi:MAG: hypothetical protein JSW34_05135 [Candidatus Zixiibacteriota bacterium]|nr:MAG: hypothetical protein JSW34_05135 [candidate division Zixibacteria bacterium]